MGYDPAVNPAPKKTPSPEARWREKRWGRGRGGSGRRQGAARVRETVKAKRARYGDAFNCRRRWVAEVARAVCCF